NLCATIDINRLGQSQPTLLQHDMETYRRRWEAFGWEALIVDGHDIPALQDAYRQAERVTDRPSVVLARTMKGKGMLAVDDKQGDYGQSIKPHSADKIVAAPEQQLKKNQPLAWHPKLPHPVTQQVESQTKRGPSVPPPYKPGAKDVAPRRAF